MTEGVHSIEIIPYKAGKGNPNAEEGEDHFERTYYVHRKVGPEEKWLLAGKTFGKPDPITEYRAKLAKEGASKEELRSMNPQRKQLFLLVDRKATDKGIQLWDVAAFNFGDLLLERINTADDDSNWRDFYFPEGMDDEYGGGSTLRITVSKETMESGTFLKVTAIDFTARKNALPEKIVNHGYCLDDMLIEASYDELSKAFFGAVDDDDKKDMKSKDKEDKSPTATSASEWGDTDADAKVADAPKKGRGRPPKAKDESNGAADKSDKPDKAKDDVKKPSYGRNDEISYKGVKYTILKVLEDSLRLVDEAGEIEDGVSFDDVSPWSDEKAAKSSKAEKNGKADDDGDDAPKNDKASKKEPSASAGGSGKSWDDDWDK